MSYEVEKQVLTGHKSDVNSLDFSHSDLLVSGSNDKTLRVWIRGEDGRFAENVSREPKSPLTGHKYGVNCVRFSPFDTIIASASTDGSIIMWSAKDGQQVVRLNHGSGGVIRTCCFSPSSAILATGGDDETICLWDISTRTQNRSLVGHEAMVTTCAFSPDSNFLVSGATAGDLRLWDACLGHGKCLFSVPDAHDLGVCACDFSSQYETDNSGSDSQVVYLLASSGNDDKVKLWKVVTGPKCSMQLDRVLDGHTGNVNCCRFSVDGSLLASAAGDKSVIVWKVGTGTMLNKLQGHSRFVTSCAFSPDNRLLATGSNDKSVIVWMIDQRSTRTNGTQSLLTNHTEKSMVVRSRCDIVVWTVDDVLSWMRELGLDAYDQVFRQNQIDGAALLHLTHEILQSDLKIDSFADRNKILTCITSMCTTSHLNLPHDDSPGVLPELLCPITREVMRDPVVATDGFSYERRAILKWITSGNKTSPMTNQQLQDLTVLPNRTLALLIQRFAPSVPSAASPLSTD